ASPSAGGTGSPGACHTSTVRGTAPRYASGRIRSRTTWSSRASIIRLLSCTERRPTWYGGPVRGVVAGTTSLARAPPASSWDTLLRPGGELLADRRVGFRAVDGHRRRWPVRSLAGERPGGLDGRAPGHV